MIKSANLGAVQKLSVIAPLARGTRLESGISRQTLVPRSDDAVAMLRSAILDLSIGPDHDDRGTRWGMVSLCDLHTGRWRAAPRAGYENSIRT